MFSTIRKFIVIAAVGAIILIVGYIIAPYNTGNDFHLYENQANNIALKIQNGEAVNTPFLIGKYNIKQVGIQNGVVHLWTKLNPNGNSGFVQHPEGKGYNLWHCSNVSTKWSYVIED